MDGAISVGTWNSLRTRYNSAYEYRRGASGRILSSVACPNAVVSCAVILWLDALFLVITWVSIASATHVLSDPLLAKLTEANCRSFLRPEGVRLERKTRLASGSGAMFWHGIACRGICPFSSSKFFPHRR